MIPEQTQEEKCMASVSLQHIYKVYSGNVTAVSDFTLDIEDKEFIVLVGPSGCGKSTTLRITYIPPPFEAPSHLPPHPTGRAS